MPRKQGCSHAGEAEEQGCVSIGLEAGAARLPNSLKQQAVQLVKVRKLLFEHATAYCLFCVVPVLNLPFTDAYISTHTQ
jgi:hypothetical protein